LFNIKKYKNYDKLGNANRSVPKYNYDNYRVNVITGAYFVT